MCRGSLTRHCGAVRSRAAYAAFRLTRKRGLPDRGSAPPLQHEAERDIDHSRLLAAGRHVIRRWRWHVAARVVARHRLQLGAVVRAAEHEQPDTDLDDGMAAD